MAGALQHRIRRTGRQPTPDARRPAPACVQPVGPRSRRVHLSDPRRSGLPQVRSFLFRKLGTHPPQRPIVEDFFRQRKDDVFFFSDLLLDHRLENSTLRSPKFACFMFFAGEIFGERHRHLARLLRVQRDRTRIFIFSQRFVQRLVFCFALRAEFLNKLLEQHISLLFVPSSQNRREKRDGLTMVRSEFFENGHGMSLFPRGWARVMRGVREAPTAQRRPDREVPQGTAGAGGLAPTPRNRKVARAFSIIVATI